MSPSLSAYLDSVRPKVTPQWTKDKPKANGYYWQCSSGDRKSSVIVLIDRGRILRPGTDEIWSLEACGPAEYFGPLVPPE